MIKNKAGLKYRYLLFDADDTLLDFLRAEKTALKKVLIKNRLPHDDMTIKTYSRINLKCWKMYEEGKIKRDEIFSLRFSEFLNILNSSANPLDVNHQYFLELSKCHFVFPYAKNLLKYAAKNYNLYIITNGVALTQRTRLRQSGLDKYFKELFISEELGFQKPSSQFFDRVVSSIGDQNRDNYLIIGDSLSSDILGGKNAEIDTMLITLRKASSSFDIVPNYEAFSLKELKKML